MIDKTVTRLIQGILQKGLISGLFASSRPMRSYFFALRELQAQVDMDGAAKSEHKKRIRELLKFIEKQKNTVFVFDEALVRKLLEKVTVHDDYLEFRFKSGVTVSVEK